MDTFKSKAGSSHVSKVSFSKYDNSDAASSCSSLTFEDGTEVRWPDWKLLGLVETTYRLKKIIPVQDNPRGSKVYKSSFTGDSAAKALMEKYAIRQSEAEAFCETLRLGDHIHHVCGLSRPFVADSTLYRLTCDHQPEILNSFIIWPKRVACNDPIGLTFSLLNQIRKIEKRVEKNGRIYYQAAWKTRIYARFEAALCELHAVDLSSLDNDKKMAMGINVFNIMMKYSEMKIGVGKTSSARMAFFTQVKFRVGDHLFSFHEWEHGFLRGNRKAPHGISLPFSKRDPRIQYIVRNANPRLHFALTNCSQRASQIQHFTGVNILDEFFRVTTAYCERDQNVRIEESSLYLNQVFLWYRQDFEQGEGKRSLPAVVRDLLPHCQTRDLLVAQLAKYQEKIKVHVMKYDWGDSDVGTHTFHPSCLKAERNRSLQERMTTRAAN